MSLRGIAGAISLAAGLWSFIFRSRIGSFWLRMGLGAGTLAALAIANSPELREERVRLRDVAEGAVSAGVLYLIFQGGDRLARRILPAGEAEINAIYDLRGEAPRPVIAALLLTVVAPGEELFWQGLVQRTLMKRFGRVRGTAAAVGAYGAVHLLTGNLTLAAAAGTAGAYWSVEYALEGRLAPTLISHVLWDVWIFLVAPTATGKKR